MFRIDIHEPVRIVDVPKIRTTITDPTGAQVGASTTQATSNLLGRAMISTTATLPDGRSWYASTTCDPNEDGNTVEQVGAELMQHVAQTIVLPGDLDTVLSVLHAMFSGARSDW